MNFDLSFYFAVFLRRFPIFLTAFALVVAGALTAAYTLPAAYQASAQLLVESPQIPDDLAESTVQTKALEQLQIIEQMLMTRANLIDIATKYRVPKTIDQLTPDQIVAVMTDRTTISRQAGRDQATLMTLTFEAETAQAAAGVVNEYVTLIQRDDVAIRTGRASDTLEFFQQQVDRLGAELDRQSSKIVDFKSQNADALPDDLEFRLGQQAALQERLVTTERELSGLKDQRARLVQIFEATGRIEGTGSDTRSPEAKQLDSLRDELTSALAVYSQENPKVKLLQAKIKTLEEIVLSQGAATGATAGGGQATILDVQLAELDTRIELASETRDQISNELAKLKDSISRTPANQIALDALSRDYQNIQVQYNTAVDRLSKAATGERIELLSKGQRISVIEAATVPSGPSKPNRMLIAAGGVVGGTLLGLAIIVLIELMNHAVRRPSDLVSRLGITPIATVPYIRTPAEARTRRGLIALMLLIAVVGLPSAIYAVHTFYEPLDLIFAKIAGKLGMNL